MKLFHFSTLDDPGCFKRSFLSDLFLCLFAAGIAFFLYYAFTGFWPFSNQNPYNSYSLQADAWLHGRLDLGQNYEHLELAVFNGKYYVSFPPFPSYLLLPFTSIFGTQTPDFLLSMIVFAIGLAYSLRLFYVLCPGNRQAWFWSLFLTIGSNLYFTTAAGGWVWFFAQTLCFTLSILCLYHAVTGQIGLSLFFWACSVGCRPLQAVWLPVLLLLFYSQKEKKTVIPSVSGFFRSYFPKLIPAGLIALSYLLLNYFRFGNPLEFGHNYLPEFTEATYGQFSFHYLPENLHNLFRLPALNENHSFGWYQFNGFAFWLASPIFLSFLFVWVKELLSLFPSARQNQKNPFKELSFLLPFVLIPLTVFLHFFTLCMHKTMGGWHFGNRYTNDALPYLFTGLLLLLSHQEKKTLTPVHIPLFLLGFGLNLIGTTALMNGWL